MNVLHNVTDGFIRILRPSIILPTLRWKEKQRGTWSAMFARCRSAAPLRTTAVMSVGQKPSDKHLRIIISNLCTGFVSKFYPNFFFLSISFKPATLKIGILWQTIVISRRNYLGRVYLSWFFSQATLKQLYNNSHKILIMIFKHVCSKQAKSVTQLYTPQVRWANSVNRTEWIVCWQWTRLSKNIHHDFIWINDFCVVIIFNTTCEGFLDQVRFLSPLQNFILQTSNFLKYKNTLIKCLHDFF